MSQKGMIRAALERGESLTRKEIDRRFDCCKGPARISDLRTDGLDIKTRTLHWVTMKGVKKTCAEWYLAKPPLPGMEDWVR